MTVKIDWNQLSQEAREDRRRGKRVVLNYNLEVRGADEQGVYYVSMARTRNVSEHGCCFEIGRAVKQGEVVSLQVMRRGPGGGKESTKPMIFRLCWVARENDLWISGAEMTAQEKLWDITFPPKAPPLKPK